MHTLAMSLLDFCSFHAARASFYGTESGMDTEEARTMLLKVFDPARDTTQKFDAEPGEKGTLSHGVSIEAPFTCLYGYNLKVMDNVYIGRGTRAVNMCACN